MDEGDADAGGGVAEEGVEAEVVAAGPCPIMYPHKPPPVAREIPSAWHTEIFLGNSVD